MIFIAKLIGFIIGFAKNTVVYSCIAAAVISISEMIYLKIKEKKARTAGTFLAAEAVNNAFIPDVIPEAPVKKIALITGASSGLGQDFARKIVTDEPEISEIWLTARREGPMLELARTLGKTSRVIPADLTKIDDINKITDALGNADGELALFVNCAGLGKIGSYESLTAEEEDRIIDVNCKAAVNITRAVIPFMKEGGRIIEICSTASFQPLQYFNVYAASKSFLYYYSRGLRMELMPKRINVTASCPFWMNNTEFLSTANASKLDKHGKPYIRHFAGGAKSSFVAGRSLTDSRLGFAVSTPGAFYTIHRLFAKLMPREVLMWFWEVGRRL